MGVKLPSVVPDQAKWYPIDLGGGQAFEVQIRRPTFDEQVAILGAETMSAHTRMLISTMILDWRGVEDDVTPPQTLPFSLDSLWKLISVYPQSLRQITSALNDVFYVYPVDLEKNLPTPPENGGTTMIAETTVSTDCLNSGSNSADASGSGESSGKPSSC